MTFECDPQPPQAGQGETRGDPFVLTAQPAIELPQAQAFLPGEPVFKGFTEKGDTVVRPTRHWQPAAGRAEKRTRLRKVRHRRIRAVKQVAEQVGQGQVVATAAAAGAVATPAGVLAASLQKERIEGVLQCRNRCQSLLQPLAIRSRQRRHLQAHHAQQAVPVTWLHVRSYHPKKKMRHRRRARVPQ